MSNTSKPLSERDAGQTLQSSYNIIDGAIIPKGFYSQNNLIKRTWRKWTGEEDRFLVENYAKLGPTQCSKTLNRTVESILGRTRKLKLKISYISNRNSINLVGKKFGKLTVTARYTGEKPNCRSYNWYYCQCECGNEVLRPSKHLNNDDDEGLRSCGCSFKDAHKHRVSKKRSKLSDDLVFNVHYTKWKKSAEVRNIEWNLDVFQLLSLIQKQEYKCYYTGNKLVKERNDENTFSLDRIDSKKPYTLDNVVFTSTTVNFMKQDLDIDHFIRLCKIIAERF